MRIIYAALVIFAFTSCGKSVVDEERSKLENDGWRFFEVFGKEKKDVTPYLRFEASTANELTVGISVAGKQIEKSYDQKQWIYHASTFVDSSGDSFALLYRKANK